MENIKTGKTIYYREDKNIEKGKSRQPVRTKIVAKGIWSQQLRSAEAYSFEFRLYHKQMESPIRGYPKQDLFMIAYSVNDSFDNLNFKGVHGYNEISKDDFINLVRG